MCNFTKHEKCDGKVVATFRLKEITENAILYASKEKTLRERSQGVFFYYPARQGGLEGEMKQEKGNAT